VANNFTDTGLKVLNLAVFSDLNPKLSQVIDQLLDCILSLALKIFKIDENSKFARLKAEVCQMQQ
jgi:hypothetical protein